MTLKSCYYSDSTSLPDDLFFKQDALAVDDSFLFKRDYRYTKKKYIPLHDGLPKFTANGFYEGFVPEQCVKYRRLEFENSMLAQLSKSIKGDNNKQTSYLAKDDFDAVFGKSVKNPETLDDSDLDILLSDSSDTDYGCENPWANNEVDTVGAAINTYLLIGNNKLHFLGDHRITVSELSPIISSMTITTNPKLNDILVLITSSGNMYSTIAISDKIYYLQSFYLGCSSLKWRLIRNEQSMDEFVVINEETGMIRFFKFIECYKFVLVNNLILKENTIIKDYAFFPNSHNLLFIVTQISQRNVLFCIEWDSGSDLTKEVHQLTYLDNSHCFSLIPVGYNKVLYVTDGKVRIVTANQIMSGDVSFQSIRADLKTVVTWFDAPLLVQKLHNIDLDTFGKYTNCTILGCSLGNIYCCLVNELDDIAFYSLTRFKGLTNLYPSIGQQEEDDSYNILVMSFNRIVSVSINLDYIQLVEQFPKRNCPIESIEHNETIDFNGDKNTQLILVDKKIWLSAPHSISEISDIPVRATKHEGSIPAFQVYNTIKYCRGNKQIGEQLILATDNYTMSACFSIEEDDIVLLDDLIEKPSGSILHFEITDSYMIQVTGNAVSLELLNSQNNEHGNRVLGSPKIFCPGVPIQGVCHRDRYFIVYNRDVKTLWYADDLENTDDISFKFQQLNFESIAQDANFSLELFCLGNDTVLSYLNDSGNSKLFNITDLLIENFEPLYTLPVLTTQTIQIREHILCSLKDNNLWILVFSRSVIKIVELPIDIEQDFQIIKYTDNSAILFSSNDVYLISIDFSGIEVVTELFKIKLPHQGKLNYIVDVTTDGDKLFVLFSTGLDVFSLSYSSFIAKNYLLKYTKFKKDFVYLESINRMLVCSLQYKQWDCLKLENGKTLSLPNDILKETKEELTNIVLINVSESVDNDLPTSFILLTFQTEIKAVKILPINNRITAQEIACYKFNGRIKNKVIVKDHSFYIFQYGEEDMDSFFHLTVSGGNKIIILDELKIQTRGQITDFIIFGNSIAFSVSLRPIIYIIKEFGSRSITSSTVNGVGCVKLPIGATATYLYRISDTSFVACVPVIGNPLIKSKMLFYNIDEIQFIENCPSIVGEENEYESLLERIETLNVVDNSDYMRKKELEMYASQTVGNGVDTNEIFSSGDSEYVEISKEKVFDRDSSLYSKVKIYVKRSKQVLPPLTMSAAENWKISECKANNYRVKLINAGINNHPDNEPYSVISLDKYIEDLSYEEASGKLYILTKDQSLFRFKDDPLIKIHNSAHRISKIDETITNSGCPLRLFKDAPVDNVLELKLMENFNLSM